MIKSLKLKNVGPLPDATINFGKRLNIITGDNGLGKSFLLDIIWFGLTGWWPNDVNGRMTSGYMARPLDVTKEASIEIIYDKKDKMNNSFCQFKYERLVESWCKTYPQFLIIPHSDKYLIMYNDKPLIIDRYSINNAINFDKNDILKKKSLLSDYLRVPSQDDLLIDKLTSPISIKLPSAQENYVDNKFIEYFHDEIRKRNSPQNNDNLVLYAHYDGSFSVDDFTRGNNKLEDLDIPHAFVLTPSEVWDGTTIIDKKTGKEVPICNGLIRDWVSWQDRHKDDSDDEFSLLVNCLEKLSPPDFSKKLAPAEHGRISADDSREHPFIQMPYGNTPAVWASAGIRRMLTLAYMLTWMIAEHMKRCNVLGMKPASQMTFLFDEVDAHLHPKWQRQIMGGILSVLESLTKTMAINTQIISVTHSPLVMASLEALFDKKTDKWLDLDLNMVNGNVQIEERKLIKMGDVSSWLTSDAFDLKSTYSLEAEKTMDEYDQLMSQPTIDSKKRSEIIKRLEKLLPDTDPFWYDVDFPKQGGSK